MTTDDLKTEIKTWYQSPYAANMNAAHWFLFLGFLMCCAIAWSTVVSTMLRNAP